MSLYTGGQYEVPDEEPDDEPDYPDATGRLPLTETLFVLAHDEKGRPRFHPRILDVGIATAVLAELIIVGAVRCTDGPVRLVAVPPARRELLGSAARLIGGTLDAYGVTDWLHILADNAAVRAGDALVAAGLCERESGRRLGLFRVQRVRFTVRTLLPRAEAWYNNALTWSTQLGPADAVLASLGRDLGMLPPAYADLSGEAREQRRELILAAMDDQLRAVVAAARKYVTDAAFGAYN